MTLEVHGDVHISGMVDPSNLSLMEATPVSSTLNQQGINLNLNILASFLLLVGQNTSSYMYTFCLISSDAKKHIRDTF